MDRLDLNDLKAFVAVAQERSFTRAAAKLGVSQSSLSHTIRHLEDRLSARLLTRTTRSVATTETGQRLLDHLAPRLSEIEAEVRSITDLREKPSGTLRITTGEHAAETILWPTLAAIVRLHPDLKVEVCTDPRFTDIVTDKFDAGIRLGERVAKDMVAVRIGPDLRMAVVGSPDYFARHPPPLTPQDLTRHHCINMRLATAGGLYAWEFSQGDRAVNIRVDGRMVFNATGLIRQAALDGLGLAFLIEDMFSDDLASGRLVRALDGWCEPFSGYHLYYPASQPLKPALAMLIKSLRRKANTAHGRRP